MAQIVLTKFAGAGTAGVLDIMTETLDNSRGWSKPFRRSRDYVRVLEVGGGIFLTAKNMAPNFAEGVALGATSLVVQSAWDTVQSLRGGKTSARVAERAGTGRVAQAVRVGAQVGPEPQPQTKIFPY